MRGRLDAPELECVPAGNAVGVERDVGVPAGPLPIGTHRSAGPVGGRPTVVVLIAAISEVSGVHSCALRVQRRGQREAVRNPGAVEGRVHRELVVRDVEREALDATDTGLIEAGGGVARAVPRAVARIEVHNCVAVVTLDLAAGVLDVGDASLRQGRDVLAWIRAGQSLGRLARPSGSIRTTADALPRPLTTPSIHAW